MKKVTWQQGVLALTAFLAAWQGSKFSLDLNSVMGALYCALAGGATTKPKTDSK